MKVLVTGATGFIGSYVMNLLNKTKHEIYAISRKIIKQKNFCQADILNIRAIENIIKTINPDVLIHLAWDVSHGEFWNALNNEDYAEASKRLFDLFIKNGGKKIIATGTCAEYPASDKPVSEDIEYDGELTPYGHAKKSVANYLLSENFTKNIEFTWLRIFGICGEGEDERRLFPKMIYSITKNEEFIPQNPNSYFDYVYVGDVAKFIVDCIVKKGCGVVNIGTGKSLAVKDIYETLKNYVQINLFEIKQSGVFPDLGSRIPDCNKVQKLGFQFSLEKYLLTNIGDKLKK